MVAILSIPHSSSIKLKTKGTDLPGLITKSLRARRVKSKATKRLRYDNIAGMEITDFDYILPHDLIAQKPLVRRDSSRLLVLNRETSRISHMRFRDITRLLKTGDVLVFNQSKVFPARVFGNKESGGKVEILFLKNLSKKRWECITKPGLKKDQVVRFGGGLEARVLSKKDEGLTSIELDKPYSEAIKTLERIGETPLPPYIVNSDPNKLRERYQTVYASLLGSTAAPTAGLHFTNSLLEELKNKGVALEFVTLHVGLGTFRPVTQKNIDNNSLHSENYLIDKATLTRLNKAKKEGKRVIAVGTTSLRVLESSVNSKGLLTKLKGSTDIFIYPPYRFRFCDSLITNFHIPHSSLLMLVSAFVSAPNTQNSFTNFKESIVGKAYEQAVRRKYRFFSFGDAMFIQ